VPRNFIIARQLNSRESLAAGRFRPPRRLTGTITFSVHFLRQSLSTYLFRLGSRVCYPLYAAPLCLQPIGVCVSPDFKASECNLLVWELVSRDTPLILNLSRGHSHLERRQLAANSDYKSGTDKHLKRGGGKGRKGERRKERVNVVDCHLSRYLPLSARTLFRVHEEEFTSSLNIGRRYVLTNVLQMCSALRVGRCGGSDFSLRVIWSARCTTDGRWTAGEMQEWSP